MQSLNKAINMTIFRMHTNRYPTMGTNKVDVHLRDGSQVYLIKCLGEKGSEGANKSNGPVTGGTAQSHIHLKHKEQEAEHTWIWLHPLPH